MFTATSREHSSQTHSTGMNTNRHRTYDDAILLTASPPKAPYHPSPAAPPIPSLPSQTPTPDAQPSSNKPQPVSTCKTSAQCHTITARQKEYSHSLQRDKKPLIVNQIPHIPLPQLHQPVHTPHQLQQQRSADEPKEELHPL